MGTNAKRYYQAHFSKQRLMDELEQMLFSFSGGRP
jgi:hypothetical protein